MSGKARALLVEGGLKGGFFLSGLLFYLQGDEVFSEFSLLNSYYSLFVNVLSFGLPYLVARSRHADASFGYHGFALSGAALVLGALFSVAVLPEYWFVVVAACTTIFVDSLYSVWRMGGDRKLFSILLVLGALIFSGNLLGNVLEDARARYFGLIFVLSAVSVFLFVKVRPKVRPVKGVGTIDISKSKGYFVDGVAFSLTHGMFWLRNGLDRILLFPVIGTELFSQYSFYFFVVGIAQNIWTSLLRMVQRQIFDLVLRNRSTLILVQSVCGLLLIVSYALLYYVGAGFVWFVALGAVTHFLNQFFVNVVNYLCRAYVYAIVNIGASAFYLGVLYASTVSVDVTAKLFAASNLILAVCYVAVMKFRIGFREPQSDV